ncbi:MAG TPA: ion transporter [Anaerolineae bacterium]|nr:ion transporter [Anaerolineae bacterium]
MADQAPTTQHPSRITGVLNSNSYIIVVLILTIFSLALMVVQFLLPEGTETWKLVNLYNNLTCIFFLIDFAMRMIAHPRKRDYFIGQQGYFDLLGSIPSFGVVPLFAQYSGLLRLFRLSRLLRLRRFMNPENRQLLKNEILNNRGSYAALLTVLMALLVICTASIFVLFFESQSPDANITTGGDSIWWSAVTITTVGYGDRYPVTTGGRLTAVFIMFSGVGIIGALASILASILLPPPKSATKPDEQKPGESPTVTSIMTVEQQLAAVRAELAAMRQLLEKKDS